MKVHCSDSMTTKGNESSSSPEFPTLHLVSVSVSLALNPAPFRLRP